MYAKGKFKLVKLLAVVICLFLVVLILLKGCPELVKVEWNIEMEYWNDPIAIPSSTEWM